FNDLDTYIDMCWDEGFRERIFNAVEERTGCKTLGFTIGIGRGVSNTKREIRTVDDMKGLKIRTIGSPIIIDTFNSFGATATNVPWKEVYTALQQGLVDGEDSSVIANLDQKFIESNKFYTQLDTMFQNHLLVVSSELWNKLTPEQQQIFVEAGVKADEYGFECSRTDIKDSYERAAKEYPDFKITSDLTPEEKQTFVDACRPVWDKYKPEVGEDLFNYTYDLMQKMVKK
ncbi:MAG: TRAP transporter substrate-binding protein, partial [Anaerotruncus rubiinfantis]